MTKDLAIIILGIFVATLPFLGFPSLWKVVLYVLAGLSIALLTFLLRRDFSERLSQVRIKKYDNGENDVYVENGGASKSPSEQKKEKVQTRTASRRLVVDGIKESNHDVS